MKFSNLSPWVRRSMAVLAAGLLGCPATERRAGAQGRVGSSRSSQDAPGQRSAEKILFVDNPDSTVTAVIQIQYAGPPQGFAWVLPVPGKPTVGVSSNAVFQRLEAATSPQYWVEVTVEGTCMPGSDASVDAGSDAGGGSSPRDTQDTRDTTAAAVVGEVRAPAGHAKGLRSTAAVRVVDQGSIGPYDYVNIRVDPALGDRPKVATDWLTMSGYDLTGLDGEVLRRTLKDDLDLLAFRLADAADTSSIRPVVLTYESQLPTVPMEPTAVAARGIEVWVVGPSQAVPDNTRSLVLNDARLDWPTGRKYVAGTLPAGGVGPFDPYSVSKPSNYDAVVTAAAGEADGQGFVTELGAPASRYRDKLWSSLDAERFKTMSHQHYADGIDAILTANVSYRDWDGWKEAIEGATTLPVGVTIDAFGRNPDAYRGAARVDAARFFHLLGEDVIRPVASAAAMLSRAPYLTRLYSTTSVDEMTAAPAFNYDPDLALVSDVHIARQFVQCAPTLEPYDAPWWMQLPQGGVIVGKGGAWPVTAGSMPANLKIVQLSTTGSGTVVKDNSDGIGMNMVKVAAATGGTGMPHPPQNGVMIGGTQTVTPHGETPPTQGRPQVSSGNACSVSRVGADASSALALWVPQAAVILALRRRHRRCGARSRGAGGAGES
jgi:hypothetical protein